MEPIAEALSSLAPQARRVREIENAHVDLRAKATAVLDQDRVATEAAEAQQNILLQTLALSDFEKTIALETRLQSVKALMGKIGFILARQERPEQLWKQRFGNEMSALASEFVPATRARLVSLLAKSEADDAKAAASVELDPSDSALTKAIREHLRSVPPTERPTWASAVRAAPLFPQ